MPLKVSVRMECAQCRKRVKIEGTPRQHRRYHSIFMPDIYLVQPPWADDESIVTVAISRGYDYTDNDDEKGLCCSADCAMELAGKYVGSRVTSLSEEAKFIRFREVASEGKTQRWIIDTLNGTALGYIRWFRVWRQYCFFPGEETIFARRCLRDIANFCESKTREYLKLSRMKEKEKRDVEYPI